ncbi:MAG: DUF3299 domain-containing protein [Gammaproteobacteria bacterium]|nr:DUF3299 domain-containing protein [Gammaproteobacteria bacterium]
MITALVLATTLAVARAETPPLRPGAPLPRAVEAPGSPANVLQLEWKDLLPPDARDRATLAPPAPLHDYLLGEDSPAARQPTDARVNAALDGRMVRLPGFIVPLEIDAEGRVTEMFLVPFFGACIHVPPPPPNQIVYVVLAAPLPLESMTDAYWVTGRMKASSRSTRLGDSAYVISAATTEKYRF